MRKLILAFLVLLAATVSAGATCTVPNTFVNGTTADGAQVTSNFTSVLSCINLFGTAGFEISGGDLIIDGGSSGKITIHPQAASGTYNFNLPTSSGSTGQLLQSGGGGIAPMTWTTSTWPSTVSANNILFASAANTITGLATANNGVLITSAGGVPSISSTLPSAVQGNITSLGTIASGVWNGSVLTVPFGGSGAATFTANAFLTGNGTSAFNAVALSGLVLGNGASAPSAYAGTSCTNQFPRSLSASGVATCATVGSSDLTSSLSLTTPNIGVATATSVNKWTFTAPVTAATLTAGGDSQTYTLPAATDTIVGRASTDTLTNKTLTSPVLTTPTLGVASATSINKWVFTAPATAATLITGADSQTYTFPAATDTLVGRNSTDTLTNKTLTSPVMTTPTLGVASATSINKWIFTAPSTAATLTAGGDSQTYTLPATTDTILGRASTDTLTNKTYDTAGTGNAFKIAGTSITATTGTGGTLATSTSPTFTTPALGVATATTINKVTFTAPATGSTLTIADGKTFTVSNTITFAGTDGVTYTGPTTSKTLLATDLSNIGTTKVALLNGGTASDLTVTGGAHQVLKQTTAGGAVTVGQLQCADLADATAACSTGSSLNQSGWQNKLRNSTLQIWMDSGTTGTGMFAIPAGGIWTASGIFCLSAGANSTWSDITPSPLSGAKSISALRITGLAGVTSVKCRFVISALDIEPLPGQVATFQIPILNGTGAGLTPTITAKYPTVADNYAGTVTDLVTTNLQTCANNATCTLAYTWAVSASATTGYEIIIDFGPILGGQTVTIGGGFDFRITVGTATGLNSSPPTPEIRDLQSDMAWNQSFFQTTYLNSVAPGSITNAGQNKVASGATNSAFAVGNSWHFLKMRCNAASTAFSPTTGTSGKARDFTNAADVTATIDDTSDAGINWHAVPSAAGGQVNVGVQLQGDCRVSGG